MPWLLVDLALVLLGLVLLAVFGLRLWTGVKALSREVGAAGEAVGAAGEELARLQAEGASRPAVQPRADTSRTTPARPYTGQKPARRVR